MVVGDRVWKSMGLDFQTLSEDVKKSDYFSQKVMGSTLLMLLGG